MVNGIRTTIFKKTDKRILFFFKTKYLVNFPPSIKTSEIRLVIESYNLLICSSSVSRKALDKLSHKSSLFL